MFSYCQFEYARMSYFVLSLLLLLRLNVALSKWVGNLDSGRAS